MNQTTIDLAKELQVLETHLKRVIQSPAFTELMESGFCNPDFTLPDALMAVQQAAESYDEMMSDDPEPSLESVLNPGINFPGAETDPFCLPALNNFDPATYNAYDGY